LAGAKQRAVLILEGTVKDLAESGIRREALQEALITVSLIFSIPVLRSMNPSDNAGAGVKPVPRICPRCGRTPFRTSLWPLPGNVRGH